MINKKAYQENIKLKKAKNRRLYNIIKKDE